MRYPLSRDFRLSFSDLKVFGSGFTRPECVLALSNGELLASHGAGGIQGCSAMEQSITAWEAEFRGVDTDRTVSLWHRMAESCSLT
jgi:hypothetical protein